LARLDVGARDDGEVGELLELNGIDESGSSS
jgi:hypothetical protein